MIVNRTRIIDSRITLIVLALVVLVLSLSLGLPRVLAQDFNFNLSDITDNSSFDFKRLLSSFKAVNGTYKNPDYGFEIAFPQGWVGTEFSGPFGKIVSTGPFQLGTNPNGLSAMSIMFVDNRNNTALATISNLTNPLGTASQGSGSDSIGYLAANHYLSLQLPLMVLKEKKEHTTVKIFCQVMGKMPASGQRVSPLPQRITL